MHQKPIDVAGSLFTHSAGGGRGFGHGSHGSRTAVGAQETTMPTAGFFVSELEDFVVFCKLWFLSPPPRSMYLVLVLVSCSSGSPHTSLSN